jgi:hypothetical protein
MKRSISLILICLVLALLAAPVQAKGAVDRITLSGPGLDVPIVLSKQDTLGMEALNPWMGGFLAGVVEAPAKGPAYTVDFFMNVASGDTAELRHIYTAEYVPDPAGGPGYFYIPGSGDDGYELNKGTIMAAERDGMWHRASALWESAVGPALRAAGLDLVTPAAAPSAPAATLPLPGLAIVAGLLVAATVAVAIYRRRRRRRLLAGRLKKAPG